MVPELPRQPTDLWVQHHLLLRLPMALEAAAELLRMGPEALPVAAVSLAVLGSQVLSEI